MNSGSQRDNSLLDLISLAFLVAGTCIGGGMLGLPLGAAFCGFLPASLALILSCFFMTLSGLLILEASFWMPPGAHMLSMASFLLGSWARKLAWVLYLFIAYASLVAYIAAAAESISYWTGLSKLFCGCFFCFFFGSFLYLKTALLTRFNAFCFFLMILAYIFLFSSGLSHIHKEHLLHFQPSRLTMALPLLLTAFSFHAIVPSLPKVLNANLAALRLSIIAGTALAFFVYFFWQLMVLGALPFSVLEAAYYQGLPATIFLRELIDSPYFVIMTDLFAFLALLTSFFGIALGLFDFLADGLNLSKKGLSSLLIISLVLLPSLFCSQAFPGAFMMAMETSGGFGDAILTGIMPVLMVWSGRYLMKLSPNQRFFGGKPLLVLVFVFYLFVFISEIFEQFGRFLCY